MRKSLEDRFWAKVKKSSGCWEWAAARGKNPNGTLGYGQFFMGSRLEGNRRMYPSHRIAWGLVCGRIPDGMNVLHRCDNQSCVRPDHLFLGTQATNVADMMRKGRKTVARGENQGSSVLTAEQVSAIRRLYVKHARYPHPGSTRMLGACFGVSRGTISDVATRSWAHL